MLFQATTPVEEGKGLRTANLKPNTVVCVHCNLTLLKNNLRKHIQRRHTECRETVSSKRYLRCQCVDGKNGIFAVEKSFHGASTPIHVLKNTWGESQRSECELDECCVTRDFAHRSGILPFECDHLQSLSYCPRVDQIQTDLAEETLCMMVDQKWFGEARKHQLIDLKKESLAEGVPLSVSVQIGDQLNKLHVSVFEKKRSYYSRLGRVMVSYDVKKNSWHCPCSMPRKSCIHKAISKWHLFHHQKDLFKKVKSVEEVPPESPEGKKDDHNNSYPPSDSNIKEMIHYMMAHKKLPSELPKTLLDHSRDLKSNQCLPRHLVPTELKCINCTAESLSDPRLITKDAKIVTFSGVIQGMVIVILH